MNLLLPFKLAWRSLVLHKGRTILTVLGIVIGIAAVIIVMSAGESMRRLVVDQVESFGTDFIEIEIKVPNTGKNSVGNAGGLAQGIQITTLKNEDAEEIGKLPNIKKYGMGIMGQAVVSYLDQNKTINYIAGSAEVASIMGSEIGKGSFYTEEDDKQLARVVLLGSKVAGDLFGDNDPVGQSVSLGRLKFKVVGVLKERGSGLGMNWDEMVYIPVKTAQKLLLGVDYLMFITAKLEDPNRQADTADAIISLLRERHETTNENDDDFSVTTAAETMDIINGVLGGVSLLLIAIAAISLLVGGVGIMNIMYVSVVERTFEIGLRKAVGAKPKQILWQFLWEAIVVTLFGGLIGIIIGATVAFLVSFAAGALGYTWKFVLPIDSVMIAFGFCGLVGLLFGYLPAFKASRLNPIVALGHE